MTKDDLIALHRLQMRDHGSSKEHAEVSIEYAISVLDDLLKAQKDSTRGWDRIKTENKIQELKALI